jgi:hypothetical protein
VTFSLRHSVAQPEQQVASVQCTMSSPLFYVRGPTPAIVLHSVEMVATTRLHEAEHQRLDASHNRGRSIGKLTVACLGSSEVDSRRAPFR